MERQTMDTQAGGPQGKQSSQQERARAHPTTAKKKTGDCTGPRAHLSGQFARVDWTGAAAVGRGQAGRVLIGCVADI